MTTFLIILLGLVMFSALMQRPLKKQAEEQRRVRESITEGSRVLLTSQLFGTVTHVGSEQLIVEIAPGVEVTAMKQAVTRLVETSEEEFEFADDAPSTSSGIEDRSGIDDPSTSSGNVGEPTAEPLPTTAEPVEAPDTNPRTV